MRAYELAEVRAAKTMNVLHTAERAHRFDLRYAGVELRSRSTPYFYDVLTQLIQVAADVQRAGGVPRIALRRNAAVSPRILLDVRIHGRDFEFASVVDLEGQAYAVCHESGAARRIPWIKRWALGCFDSPAAVQAHRVALAEFNAEMQLSVAMPTLTKHQ
ncbi:hypothetical protein FXN63_09850 [Pigmentiphaga aceris]|uniref:Uncharacterized protein n=1 Tax=Pigmentiphaga aceris TaxID=1940612 RepID=A0A5C0AWX9_9BURK|nr:hypothetical protein [Pigmentiphaga aceris]QEI06104.1 hypothetical protein FXN63_09850 [Pigmentiphaga aceris]